MSRDFEGRHGRDLNAFRLYRIITTRIATRFVATRILGSGTRSLSETPLRGVLGEDPRRLRGSTNPLLGTFGTSRLKFGTFDPLVTENEISRVEITRNA